MGEHPVPATDTTAPVPCPELSVVVMGYRNADTIVGAVRSIVDQIDDFDVEVVVVTSGPDSGMERVRSEFGSLKTVERSERVFAGAARNVGIRSTSGHAIAFLEADCRAQPGWLGARIRAHREGHVAVAGSITAWGPPTPWSVAGLLLSYPYRLPGLPAATALGVHPRAHPGSLTREVIEEVGPFREDLRIGEDTDYAVRLESAGYQVHFAPDARAAHIGPSSTRAFVRDEFRRAERFARVIRPGAPARGARQLVIDVTEAWKRARRAAAMGWAFADQPRWAILLSVPWIVAGAVANRAGHVAGRRSLTRRNAAGSSVSTSQSEADQSR